MVSSSTPGDDDKFSDAPTRRPGAAFAFVVVFDGGTLLSQLDTTFFRLVEMSFSVSTSAEQRPLADDATAPAIATFATWTCGFLAVTSAGGGGGGEE